MNILIIRFSALGDLVTMEPLFRAIRHFYPDAHIDFWTSGIGRGLYVDTFYFDDYVCDLNFFQALTKLRQKSYDIVFNLQCNRRSHMTLLCLKSGIVVNKSYNLYQKFFRLKPIEKDITMILQASGVTQQDIQIYKSKNNGFAVRMPYASSQKFQKLICNAFGKKKIIAIASGASERWMSKKWGKERYAKLASLLESDFGVILIGSKLELEDAQHITQQSPNVLDMTDKTSLNELKSLIGEVDLFVGNDSGPTHIAAAMGIPTVTIFGSTSTKHCPKHLYANQEHFCIKPSEAIKCHPCYKSKCPTNHECMEDIKPAQVYEIVQNYFQNAEQSS